MQEAEEPAPESETQRDRGLRFVGECGVVELKLVEGIAQHRVVGTVHGVQAGIDHRSRFAVAGERFCGSTARERHRVADLRLAHVLHTRDQVADLPDSEPCRRFRFGRDDPDLEQFVGGAGRHHLDLLARHDLAVDDANVGDDSAVGVVHRVEDHRACRCVGIADGRRNLPDDLVDQRGDTFAGLARDTEDVGRLASDDVCDLTRVSIGVGRRQVDLVEDRDDRQILVEREVQVRQGLRLDSLRGIDEKHGAFACLECA